MKRIVSSSWLVLALTAIIVFGARTSWGSQDNPKMESPAVAIPLNKLRMFPFGRAEAPDFSLKNLSGKMVKLSDFQGKVVLMNFWFTW